MKTIIEEITGDEKQDEAIYKKAGEILKRGGLVAFPTETVYGLGADALDETASKKIYAAKGRPSDNPLIVHIADINDLYKLSCNVNDNALKLAKAFWPGPLTIILKKSDIVPGTITGGLDTVAIRMPSHKVASKLIKNSGVYIAAPSANISGKPSPTRGQHVIHDMDGRIDMIIVDDTVDIGVESTIVDLSESFPTILRPGFITLEQIKSTLGEAVMDPAIMGNVAEGITPKAPGMKYKHYAPEANITIVDGEVNKVVAMIDEMACERACDGAKVAIMASSENVALYRKTELYQVIDMGSRFNEAEEARNLFAVLRKFDDDGIDYVFSESFSTNDVGQAVMNRLIKAAGHTIIHV
ncbi:MAG: L-threonylcarbamoyladenylate synthase [Eubacteriales bacterium]|nr:L-threonylcarbamoyladenylate synthase [Eubacteriales bacterium]